MPCWHGCWRVADPDRDDAAAIASPCRRICQYLPAAGIRGGCGRTLDEIQAWPGADAALRRAILGRAAARLAARGPDARV